MDITKIILIYVCIAIACVFWRPDIVIGDSPQASSILQILNLNATNYETLSGINHSVSTSQIFAQGEETRSGNIFLTIVDGLFNVMGYITIIFRVVFSPILIMTAGAFPVEIIYIFGIPLSIIFIISIVRFVRGY